MTVDSNVVKAAQSLDARQLGQPEWLWFGEIEGVEAAAWFSYGRWPKRQGMAPYVRVDLVPSVETSAQARLARVETMLADHARSEGRTPYGSVEQQLAEVLDRLHEQSKQDV